MFSAVYFSHFYVVSHCGFQVFGLISINHTQKQPIKKSISQRKKHGNKTCVQSVFNKRQENWKEMEIIITCTLLLFHRKTNSFFLCQGNNLVSLAFYSNCFIPRCWSLVWQLNQ